MTSLSSVLASAACAALAKLGGDLPFLAQVAGAELPASLTKWADLGASSLMLAAIFYLVRAGERERAGRERERTEFLAALREQSETHNKQLQEQRDKHVAALERFLPHKVEILKP